MGGSAYGGSGIFRRLIARSGPGSPPRGAITHPGRQIAVHRCGRGSPPFLPSPLTPSPQSGARHVAAPRAGDRGRPGPDACVMVCPAGILPLLHPRGGMCDQAVAMAVLLQVAPPCRRGPSVPAGGAARPRSAECAGLGCRGRAATGSSRKAPPRMVRHGIRIGPVRSPAGSAPAGRDAVYRYTVPVPPSKCGITKGHSGMTGDVKTPCGRRFCNVLWC